MAVSCPSSGIDFAKLDTSASDFDWLRGRYALSGIKRTEWKELFGCAEELSRRKTADAQRAVRNRGLQLSYRGDGCFGNETCEWVLRTDSTAAKFDSWEEFSAAWREAIAVVKGSLAAVRQGESQARLLRGTGVLDRELDVRWARDQILRSSLSSKDLQLSPSGLAVFKLVIGLHISRADRSNTDWLRNLIASSGWPNSQNITSDRRAAAWFIVVHARHDPAFRLDVLSILKTAAKDGRITHADLATKTDHILSETTGLQRYGTKGDCIQGRFVPVLSEKPEAVPRLRRELELPSLQEQAEMMQSACST